MMGDINIGQLKMVRKCANATETLASYNTKRIVLPPAIITPDSNSSIVWICTNGILISSQIPTMLKLMS